MSTEIEWKLNKNFKTRRDYNNYIKIIGFVIRMKKAKLTYFGYNHNFINDFNIFTVKYKTQQ
jgi:hypothetical protein